MVRKRHFYDLESDIKYEGYIKRHQNEIKKTAKNENRKFQQKLLFQKFQVFQKKL